MYPTCVQIGLAHSFYCGNEKKIVWDLKTLYSIIYVHPLIKCIETFSFKLLGDLNRWIGCELETQVGKLVVQGLRSQFLSGGGEANHQNGPIYSIK